MLNHIHLIASSPDMIAFVRDFKKFTSKEIQKNIIATEPNVLKLFEMENGRFEFWEKTNMPKMIKGEHSGWVKWPFFRDRYTIYCSMQICKHYMRLQNAHLTQSDYLTQKINYIHANPVRKQYVKNPEDWVWSSANTEGKINIDSVV